MAELRNRESFHRAHARAVRQDWLAKLSGKENDLLPFEVVADVLQVYEQMPRPDTEMVPLDRIVGSVGRYKDFTRDFLPRNPALADRWALVENAMESLTGVPPIEVYRLGSVYFVADGNHRVSVARASGFDAIEAHVTEIPAPIHLEPGDTLDTAIVKAERAHFLAETRLDHHDMPLDIYFTLPGGFRRLLQHVRMHQRTLEAAQTTPEPICLQQAALDWYLTEYQPIVGAIRERQLLQRFPGRTAADLYVWVWGFIMEAHHSLGERIEPAEAAAMMELRAESEMQTSVLGVMNVLAQVSRQLTGGPALPDWVTQTFEWGDGSLSAIGEQQEEAPRV